MNGKLRLIAWLVAVVGLVYTGSLSADQEGQRTLVDGQIRECVRNLNSDDFWIREEATNRLSKAGQAAINPLATAIEDGNPEVSWRAFRALREICISEDLVVETEALTALLKLRESPKKWIARSATRALTNWRQSLHRRAVSEIRKRGGTVRESSTGTVHGIVMLGGGRVVMVEEELVFRAVEVRIDADAEAVKVVVAAPLRGPKDAVEISKQAHVERKPAVAAKPGGAIKAAAAKPVGRQTVDDLLKAAGIETRMQGQSTTLQFDQNWKGGDDGLRYVTQLINVTTLELRDADITEAALEHFAQLPHLQRMMVHQGRISGRALRRFRSTRPDLYLFATGEGFLGVRGEPDPKGLRISYIYPGGSADKAGVQKGDVIATLNGEPLKDICSLTLCVFDQQAGLPLKLVVLRAGKRLTLEGTLSVRGNNH